MLVTFFVWWYGEGWIGVFKSLPRRAASINADFSTKALFKTLFAPWRRIITYPGKDLNSKMKALGDNLFSRVVGFFVRVFVIMAAGLMLIVSSLATLVEAIFWPILPVAWIIFVVLAVMG